MTEYLKQQGRKTLKYKGNIIRIVTDFHLSSYKPGQWDNILQF